MFLARAQGRVCISEPWVWVGQCMAHWGRLGVAYARGWAVYVDGLVDAHRTLCLRHVESWGYALGPVAQMGWLGGI